MISPRKWETLRKRMRELGIREADVEEKFVRSSGRGGQNVNKVNTCVMLLHRPTDVRIKCMVSRLQGDNRFHARRILCEKIEERVRGKKSAAERERHRIRQQKRKRSRRAREKMLRMKKKRAEKKRLRMDPAAED